MADSTLKTPEEIRAEVLALITKQEFAEAVALGYQNYEALVAHAKESGSKDSTSTKAVREHVQNLEEYEPAHELASEALDVLKMQVFNLIQENPLVAVAFYDLIGDWNSGDVKLFRDHVLKFYKADVATDDEEGEELDFDKDDLESLKVLVESAWNIAQRPEPKDKKSPEFNVATRKSGEKYLKFSRLPKGLGEKDETSPTENNGVTVKRQVYYVDGERSTHRNLSGVAMWELSDGIHIFTASDVKAAVEKATGQKFGESGDFSIEFNGHKLERRIES